MKAPRDPKHHNIAKKELANTASPQENSRRNTVYLFTA